MRITSEATQLEGSDTDMLPSYNKHAATQVLTESYRQLLQSGIPVASADCTLRLTMESDSDSSPRRLRACRPGDKRRRHPVAKIKGGWTEAEDDRLMRYEPAQINRHRVARRS